MLTNEYFMITRSLLKDNKIVYVSTPITTGETFINWYSSIGKNMDKNSNEYRESKAKNVIVPNVSNAKECVKKMRQTTNNLIIDPTNLESELVQWSQEQFYQFWDRVIKDLVNEIIFLDGWEYSIGCCHEYLSAIKNNIEVYNQYSKLLCIEEAKWKIEKSISVYKSIELQAANKLTNILSDLMKYEEESNVNQPINISRNHINKDDKLDFLISKGISNIAQFVSFEPNTDLVPKYVHINDFVNYKTSTTKEVIEKLISSAPSKSVNIRSFSIDSMKGNQLIFNKTIEDINYIMEVVRRNSLSGKYSIINENIDINDGGVSGVALGDVIEFSPEDTPKCVDKEGVCSLPRNIGFKILKTVYGFGPDINFDPNYRIEFSIHPIRQGVNKKHTIIWEYEYYENINYDKKILWPNRFSRFIGDKAFGLLIADAYGLPVPRTTVISRKVAPFYFGTETGSKEKWIRTCPINKEPGKYYTGFSWTDPFELMKVEESKGDKDINLASLLSQDAVVAVYSGASFIRLDEKNDLIEGVAGKGDKFMVGEREKENLPNEVINAVKELNNQLRIYHGELGDVSIEWVYDGTKVWVVQINQLRVNNEKNTDDERVIVEGNPLYYEKVFVRDGLDNLREKIGLYKNKNIGIELIGNIGITSHFGDLLRLSNVPAILRIED